MTTPPANPTEKITGESVTGLGWMVAGAGVLALVAAPLIANWIGLSVPVALLLAGAALAYMATGGLRKAGQGAAVYAIASLAITWLAPILNRIPILGGMTQREESGVVV